MLRLEIEFLSGVCYAASERDASIPEYPPQADRIFSAFVATWAARGEDAAERTALEWLERQAPPTIVASMFSARSSVEVFVPPNDPQSGREGNLRVLPAYRRRQPRRFPAAIPTDAMIGMNWNVEIDDITFEHLAALAADLVYVGHSASFVRAHFSRTLDTTCEGLMTRRAPYAGRLAELERAFQRGERSRRGQVVLQNTQPAIDANAGAIFAKSWIVLPGHAGDDDFVPDTRATAIVSKRMRDALMSSFGQNGQPVPTWISGHDPDGSPTRDPHIAIVPMLDVDHAYARGGLMGIGLIAPANVADADELLIRALLRLRVNNAELPHMRLDFGVRGAVKAWRLGFTDNDARSSLRSENYVPKFGARRWASVTPIVIDRHPRKTANADDGEILSLVAKAVERVGMPTPTRVITSKHGAVEGVISAYPSGNAPPWTRWATPASIATRRLTHAVIEFAEPVSGPIIIGAGRFMGLGLMRPLND